MGNKLKDLKRKFLLHKSTQSFRFPTLTRPYFNAPILPTRFLEKQVILKNQILERICLAYQQAEKTSGSEDIWTELAAENSDFLSALRNNDYARLRTFFQNMFHGRLTYGMAHTDIFLSKKTPYSPQYFTLRVRDSILALAEALSVKNLHSNQQTSFEDYMHSTNGNLELHIENIEKALGHSVCTPNVGRPPVASVGKYLINPDSTRHAYVMFRVKQLGFNPEDPILEIGGGFGNVARYAFLQGFRNYTIIDLPYVSAIQAAFLAATIGEENISLFNETQEAPIKIIPSIFKAYIKQKFSLTLNMDSLPEINLEEAISYLNFVQNSSQYFLSINQEAKKTHKGSILQHSVPDMIEGLDNFKRLHRHPYWMEQGYAEELYKVEKYK